MLQQRLATTIVTPPTTNNNNEGNDNNNNNNNQMGHIIPSRKRRNRFIMLFSNRLALVHPFTTTTVNTKSSTTTAAARAAITNNIVQFGGNHNDHYSYDDTMKTMLLLQQQQQPQQQQQNLDDNSKEYACTFDEMIYDIRKNQITTLRIGWTYSNYFPHSNNTANMSSNATNTTTIYSNLSHQQGHQYYQKFVLLERALRLNTSIQSISLGYKLSTRTLIHILQIIHKSIPVHQLLYLKIVVLFAPVGSSSSSGGGGRQTMIPNVIISNLLQKQQKLVSIDLRSVQVVVPSKLLPQQHDQPIAISSASATPRMVNTNQSTTLTAKSATPKIVPRRKCNTPSSSSSSSPYIYKSNTSVITNCIIQQYQSLSNLQSLYLIDCNITNDIVMELAQFIHILGTIQVLSLRNNRQITRRTCTNNNNNNLQNGLRMICQAPILQLLDLSLCDFDSNDILSIADGIALRQYPLGELVLCGNYRCCNIHTTGIQTLFQTRCCSKIVIINLSYCSISSDQLITIFNTLTQSHNKHDTENNEMLLRRIVLCGASIGGSKFTPRPNQNPNIDSVAQAIGDFILSNSSVRSIHLHDPQEPKVFTKHQLQHIADCIQHNYEIEELLFDHRLRCSGTTYTTNNTNTITNDRKIWDDIQFYLQLNCAGRRILRPHQQPSSIANNVSLLLQKLNHNTNTNLHSHTYILRHLLSYNNDWLMVLENANIAITHNTSSNIKNHNNFNVLHWLVRHGTAMMIQHFASSPKSLSCFC